jgi:C1A family cysteine protease
VGGHEVELHGVDISSKYVIGTNSWGADWGVKGRFKLSWENLDRLLQEDGDAVTVVSC